MGVEAATEIYTQGLCLEESLAALPEAGADLPPGQEGGALWWACRWLGAGQLER